MRKSDCKEPGKIMHHRVGKSNLAFGDRGTGLE
jgi:hypothetical protein